MLVDSADVNGLLFAGTGGKARDVVGAVAAVFPRNAVHD